MTYSIPEIAAAVLFCVAVATSNVLAAVVSMLLLCALAYAHMLRTLLENRADVPPGDVPDLGEAGREHGGAG